MSWIIYEKDEHYHSFDDSSSSSDSDIEETATKDESQRGSDEDPDGDDDTARTHGPKTTSERRRAQNDVLKAFAANISSHLTQKEVDDAAAKTANEEQLSIRDILARQEGTVRITNPRDYQTELFQRAKSENVIAVLDTGSGKTHIATLLLQHVLNDELERRAAGGIHKIAFFLVDSVNLVFQQANVLRCGLDQKVEGICGAMGASLWSKATWQSHYEKNMVIVCTAEVLVQCMMHSFITMAQINLLIFDEAHHAKNNHPYARLMKDYYVHGLDPSHRPRIFGMTASPIDTKGLSVDHIKEVANDLEKLLHSKIVTTSEGALASNSISRPTEEIAVYARLQDQFETPLHQEIKAKYGDIPAFKKLFLASKRYGSELGRWASDMYWSFAFADEQSRKLEDREHLKHNKAKRDDAAQEWDAQSKRLQEAATFVQQFDFGLCTLSDKDLSSKVLKLHHWLQLYYERGDEARCIVFVEQRQTARLLQLIFSQIGGPNLRCNVLVGVNNRAGEHNISLRNQILTVAKFRRGELNCLFATSVAEEGLDIPQCNLVVRFDLYRTMIAYVQSRGRARHRNSKYLHMIEQGNDDHRSRVFDVKFEEGIMRKFCKALPQDRQIGGGEVDMLSFEDKMYPSFVTKSGAKLTYRSSLSILNHFVATLPGPDRQTMLQPTYVINPEVNYDAQDSQRRGFVCEVMLPEHAPVISVTGDVQSRKTIAKCSAAYKACLMLHAKGYMDDNLLPTTCKSLPAGRNALLALSEKKKGMYSMLIKPNFWKVDRGVVPTLLYLTVIDLDAGLDRPHQPMGLLTRIPFPQMPHFPIYLTDGRPSNVVSKSVSTPLPVSPEMIEALTIFTLRIYEDIYNKVYEEDVQKISYWVVPVTPSQVSSVSSVTSLDQILDVEQIRKVCKEPTWKWTPETKSEDLLDRYFVDPMNGGRRYYSNDLATHLKPQDPPPKGLPRSGQKFMATILDYSDSRWAKSRDISKWHTSQPVLEVEKIPFRRNHLACVEDKEKGEFDDLKTYICPEPLHVSNLSIRFVVMCYVLPALIHRFESYLIALDACKVLGLNVSPALALEALTKDSDNSEEHGEEKINFKSGMGPNYERLEFLGDCFLKMATSLSVFVQQPDENEFEFHVRRMEMLCNKNLMETAVGKKLVVSADGTERDIQLYRFIRTEAFSRRTWYPEGVKLMRGKGLKKTEDDWLKLTHNLGDKSIADVCEAFIGAAFQQHYRGGRWNPEDWDETVKAVKLFANSQDHVMSRWSDYYDAYQKPKYQVADATAAMLNTAFNIELVHPYHFKYPRLLRSAFAHPSYPYMYENIPNYQRLEFLGDSLLDMAFIMHLYYKYPDKDPQWLTEHKTPMVSNKFLGAVCVKLGWHVHIKQNTAILSSQIRDYVLEAEEAEREADGAVDYWVTISEPPKCLADVIEAYTAAIFVDAEFDFSVVQDFFDRHLKPFFENMTLDSYENFASNHPTTRLSRLLGITFGCSEWRMGAMETETLIPGKGKAVVAMVMIHGKVWFHSLGQSGRYARVRASHGALEKLDGLPPYEFRKKYKCDCVHEGESEGKQDEEVVKAKEELMKEAMGLSI
ncbi:Dicer-like protein 1 [Alternaria viburni]|uniref:Dicer-like protein 1 n=1 Tax=Alternaria viburni TaxID=566460 RepID=UPI0020C375FD|nr:Dicer-like protein 1 [Alternaria viburni]KAI4669395.1 Dicer-like protein 1 [Alternaria viburni]